MFPKIDSAAIVRIVGLLLLATLVIVLSRCAGLWVKSDSERRCFVTGGY